MDPLKRERLEAVLIVGLFYAIMVGSVVLVVWANQ